MSLAAKMLASMWADGGRAILVVALYAIQLVISAVMGAIVATALAGALAERPIFDDAVDGDLFSWLAVLSENGGLIVTLVWVLIAIAVLYGALSWFLTGGLIAVFADDAPTRERGTNTRRFGAGGAAMFLPYARLWMWSLVPYALVIAALVLGLRPAYAARFTALSTGEIAQTAALGALPAALLWMVLRAALDYARIDLLCTPGLGSGRALLRAFRLLVRRPIALLHMLLYCAISLGIVAVYVAVTWDRPMLGTAGAVSIFALRQFVNATRYL
jgi:hypothetical protein